MPQDRTAQYIEDSTDLIRLQYQRARILRNIERDLYMLTLTVILIGGAMCVIGMDMAKIAKVVSK